MLCGLHKHPRQLSDRFLSIKRVRILVQFSGYQDFPPAFPVIFAALSKHPVSERRAVMAICAGPEPVKMAVLSSE
jgi:hypothetical protein